MENASIIWQHAAHTTPTIISLLLNKSYTKKANLLTKLLKILFLFLGVSQENGPLESEE